MSDQKASDERKLKEVFRGGIYKRRGRPGQKASVGIKNRTVSCKVEDGDKNLRCTEADVGITEYIGIHKGFSAVIKQRYSDFHVNEIDSEGKLVELTSLAFEESVASNGNKTSLNDYDDVISKEIQAKLMLLHGANFPDVEIDVTEMSKEARKQIHDAIKTVFGTNLVSNTVDRDGKKMMVIGKPKAKQRVDNWPPGKGKYVHFVLYKENMDTMEAANVIAHKLRLPVGKITYAGTKDRRAKTSQLVCVPRIHPKKLSELNGALRCLTLGNFSLRPTPLRLGDLKGNRFRIVLRNVTVPDVEINEATSSLKEKGFINYYGLQRFGSTSVPTHHIGRALLRSNWKEAIELILKPRIPDNLHTRSSKAGPSFEESLSNARNIWWETRDASAALEALGNKPRGIEGQLLMGLKRHSPDDMVNALEGVSLNTRLIYIHSYQSYVWNHVASRRLKEFGCKPVEGDLVLIEDDPEDPTDVIEEALVENEALEVDSHLNEVKQEESMDAVLDDSVKSSNRAMKSQPKKVKILTKNDLESARMADVVLPLPGYDVIYPSNIVATWYEEIMGLDGLSSASLKLNVRKYSLRGTYRKIICHLRDFSWSSVQYNDPTIELVQSDLQKLKGEEILNTVEDGSYKAAILDFCLPSSSYATMTLRELLKCDTSTHHQMTLNDYFGGKIGAKREGDKCIEDVSEAKVPRLESEDKNSMPGNPKEMNLDVKSDSKIGKSENEMVVEEVDKNIEDVSEAKVPWVEDENGNGSGGNVKKEDSEVESGDKVSKLETEITVEETNEDKKMEVLEEREAIGEETKEVT